MAREIDSPRLRAAEIGGGPAPPDAPSVRCRRPEETCASVKVAVRPSRLAGTDPHWPTGGEPRAARYRSGTCPLVERWGRLRANRDEGEAGRHEPCLAAPTRSSPAGGAARPATRAWRARQLRLRRPAE